MERYVILGLARPREAWFAAVGKWAADGSIPAEFVRCVSDDELVARLQTDRTHSAVLLDGKHASTDRDVIAAAHRAGCASIVVDDPADAHRWEQLGSDAVLAPPFTRDELLAVLRGVSRSVPAGSLPPGEVAATEQGFGVGRLVAVTGPGGTGASTAAIALAQGIARPRQRGQRGSAPVTLLADFCHYADQAVLHDAGTVAPGLSDIVEIARKGLLSRDALRANTFDVSARGYRLLLGLRRPEHWVALRQPSIERAIAAMRDAADVVIADIDADVQGADATGSHDIEDRNLLARSASAQAELVVLVGESSFKGVHALARLIDEFIRFGVPPDRLLVVVRDAPVVPSARRALMTALHELVVDAEIVPPGTLARPVLLSRWRPDGALHSGSMLPRSVPERLAGAVRRACERLGPRSENGAIAAQIAGYDAAAESGAPW